MSEKKIHLEDPMYSSYGVCGIRSDYATYNVFDVTCKNCKNTDAYKKSLAEHERILKERVQVVPDVAEEPKEVVRDIVSEVIDDIWSAFCGDNVLESGYSVSLIDFNCDKGFAVFREDKAENPRIFKITVTEMELVEKRSNE